MTGIPKPGFQPDSRERNIQQLHEAPLDVLILGGGINGAGIVRDLAMRARAEAVPLRIALLDQRHFASGTSGRNSQLIHGGLRYLKYFEFNLVQEALHERATLLRIAPHLVEPLPLMLPFYSWWDRRFYGIGLWLYDLLAGKYNIGRRRYLSREQVAEIEPGLAVNGLHSAAIYYDCRIHSARGVLENLFDAARAGAAVVNYAKASPPARAGEFFRVEVEDRLAGSRFEVKARNIVDARGPWEPSVRLVRGSHIIVPRLNASENALAYFGADGRIIFVIPWGQNRDLSLVGTTDVDHGGPADSVAISEEEIRYLLGVIHRLFPDATVTQPTSAYSSLRPLAASESGSATSATRDHRIWMEDGIVKIVGGKYTTYRSMSEEAVDLLAREIAPRLVGKCETASTPLGGNSVDAVRDLGRRIGELAREYGVEKSELEGLVRSHGLQAQRVLALLPDQTQDLTRIQHAVVVYAVRHEMARRLADVLYVSTYWGHEHGQAWEQRVGVAQVMAQLLQWDEKRLKQELELPD